jgi:predicted O-methyltransferase YrrM
MTEALWIAVDQYMTTMLVPPDAALDAALEASNAAGLPPIAVTPLQGKLLHLLARLQGARRILEIGTLGGYSTIWLARALPRDGRLITLESDQRHADVARANISRAGLDAMVDLRVGRALETLHQLAAEGGGTFDLIFIDADKQNIPGYFNFARQLSRRGSLIIVDNVVRDGRVIDDQSSDPDIQGIRKFNQLLAAESGICATAIQTVGAKGYDGFAIVLVAD